MFTPPNPVTRLSITLIATICIGELFIMLLIPYFGVLSPLRVALLDMALLSCVTVPIVIWTVTRPMNKSLLDLHRSSRKLAQKEIQMLSTLNALALARNNETGKHIIRTQKYVRLLSERLRKMGRYTNQLNDDFIDRLFKVAPLHDIGKVGIPDHILSKAGPLTEAEMATMRGHAQIGESILAAALESGDEEELIASAVKVAGGHHEKWNGSGYPRRLSGENIPLEARIMSLADVYDALICKRTYKNAWSFEDACQEIISQRGVSFDPVIVDAFIAERGRFEKIALDYQDI